MSALAAEVWAAGAAAGRATNALEFFPGNGEQRTVDHGPFIDAPDFHASLFWESVNGKL